MRVLLLADTHLGFDNTSAPRVERRRRGPDFFRNFEAALRPALDGEADVVIHAGDLLYRSRVPDALVEAAVMPLREIAARGVPVLVVPGNHERSRVPVPIFARHPNLHVLEGPRTVVVEARGLRVAFAGFPYAPEVRRRFPDLLAETRHHEPPADVRVLCVHQCIEGATCGPVGYTFRDGPDVIRARDLPRDVAVVLSGHIHRHQALAPRGAPPVLYAGSIERTSFAERDEVKRYVMLQLSALGLARWAFRPLYARPMIDWVIAGDGATRGEIEDQLRRVFAEVPGDAILRLRIAGRPSQEGWAALGAEALRAIAPPGVNVEVAAY